MSISTRATPYLDLVRVFLVPTAVADSCTGFFLAQAALGSEPLTLEAPDWLRLLGVAGVSVLVYAFGMATNDLFDVRKDRESGAPRPVARGELTPVRAWTVALSLVVVATALAFRLSVLPVFAVTVLAVLTYNGGGKRVPVLGSLVMGSCRGLNLLLGACAAQGAGLTALIDEPTIALSAAVLTLYIASVTSISLLEDRPYRRRRLRLAVAGLLIYPVAIAILSGFAPGALGLAVVFAAYLGMGWKLPPEDRSPSPHPAERVVRRGLGGIYLLDAGLLLAHALLLPALGVLALFGIGELLKRWWFRRAAR